MQDFFLRQCYRAALLCSLFRYKNIFVGDESRDIFDSELVRKVSWPGGAKVVCNVQFDDFCAKSKENDRYDFGGKVGGGINMLFEEFLKKNPWVKVTLFVIPKPTFKNFEGIYYGETKKDFDLSLSVYKELVRWIKEKDTRVEIACHGYTHIQNKKPFYLSAAEFEFLSTEESTKRLEKSLKIFDSIGIRPKGFRPPAWGIGENNGFQFIDALKKQTFEYISLSSPYAGLNFGKKKVSNVYPEYFEGMLNLPQNISIGWKMDRIKCAVDKIIAMGGVITLMGHYSTEGEWMEDGIGEHNLKKIEEVIEYIRSVSQGRVWFATLGEIANFWDTVTHENRN